MWKKNEPQSHSPQPASQPSTVKLPEPARKEIAVIGPTITVKLEISGKEDLEKRQLECGIPFWPHAFVKAHCDMNALVQAWNNEYAVLGYGDHLYDDLAAFCEIMNIRPILL